jgi:hypothetical protein
MIPSHKRSEAPERPITFRAAEDLGAFQLAELWADRMAWPVTERTPYDELAELAVMSALATWLNRWQPIAIEEMQAWQARPLDAALFHWSSPMKQLGCEPVPGLG